MPIRYAGIIPEVETTGHRVGLFDIGHMGRLELIGPQHMTRRVIVRAARTDVVAARPATRRLPSERR